MLILILIDAQYPQNGVFSFQKGSNRKNYSTAASFVEMVMANFMKLLHVVLMYMWDTVMTFWQKLSKSWFGTWVKEIW